MGRGGARDAAAAAWAILRARGSGAAGARRSSVRAAARPCREDRAPAAGDDNGARVGAAPAPVLDHASILHALALVALLAGGAHGARAIVDAGAGLAMATLVAGHRRATGGDAAIVLTNETVAAMIA
jgi:hypothetical protein